MRRALRRVPVVVATVLYAGWRRRSGVVMAAGVGVIAALELASLSTYTYVGVAQVLIGPPPGSTTATGAAVGIGGRAVADAAAVLRSPGVRKDAAALLGTTVAMTPPAAASVQRGSDIVVVTVHASNAKLAATDAVGYADAYVAAEQLTGVDSLEQTASRLTARITALGNEIAQVDRTIVSVGGPAPATTTTVTVPPEDTVPGFPVSGGANSTPDTIAPPPVTTGNPIVDGLERERTTYVDQQALLQRQVTTLDTDAEAFSGGGQVVAGGVPDTTPVSPDKVRDGVAGGVAGAVAAVVAASIFEWRRHGPIVPRFGSATASGPEREPEPAAERTVPDPAGPAIPTGPAAPVDPAPAAPPPVPVRASSDLPLTPSPAGMPATETPSAPRTVVLRRVGTPSAASGAVRFVSKDGSVLVPTTHGSNGSTSNGGTGEGHGINGTAGSNGSAGDQDGARPGGRRAHAPSPGRRRHTTPSRRRRALRRARARRRAVDRLGTSGR